MPVFNRDSLVEKLHRREQAEEDVYFGRHDRALIERMRGQRDAAEEHAARKAAHMRCPECGAPLAEVRRRGVLTEACPAGHGLWVKPEALYEIPERERDSWFARCFPYLPR